MNPDLTVVAELVRAAYLVPFIDDVEDYVWESIWYSAMALTTPSRLKRSKLLFDVVDTEYELGWSAKTLVVPSLTPGREYEFVIQRADVFKKASGLGFPGLTLSSPPQTIGDAVLTHWGRKVSEDAATQGVHQASTVILLKNRARTEFAVLQTPLEVPDYSEVEWSWTSSTRTGLQGREVLTGRVMYRWYPNQTQVFERAVIPEKMEPFTITQKMLTPSDFLLLLRSTGHL